MRLILEKEERQVNAVGESARRRTPTLKIIFLKGKEYQTSCISLTLYSTMQTRSASDFKRLTAVSPETSALMRKVLTLHLPRF